MPHESVVAAPADPLRGRLVADKYRVADRVGQGGMGTVYRAMQSGLNRQVAIKILKRELAFDPDTVARFQREANALSLLVHPNTVRVYDFGQTDDGLLFLVMELLEGELITARLNRDGVMDVLDALRVTQQILRSLSEAHQHNIVHRDLKPDNILITQPKGQLEPVVKVLDFGIAKIAAADRPIDQFETQAGTVFGTPRYMSPEQAQGVALDGRSDLYSVGTLLYLMLTGRAPFVDEDAVVVMAKHIREVPESPRLAAPRRSIPKSLDEVVMRSLAKDPFARFQDASAFEAALETCVPEIQAAAKLANKPRWLRPWSLAGLAVFSSAALALASYGLRTGAESERQLTATALPGSALPGAMPSPANDSAPVVSEGEEEVLAMGPGPAILSLRSDPDGASVFRDGARLGETPLNLLVQPGEEWVRIELRKPGFQPLLAELAARDGERLLKLAEEPDERPLPGVRNNLRDARRSPTPTQASKSNASKQRPDAPVVLPSEAPATPPPSTTPAPTVRGPYQRFD